MRSTSPWRKIRRLALARRTSEVRALLEKLLAENPQDEQALAELARLKAGKNLRCTENKKERGLREAKEARHAIAKLLDKWTIGDDLKAVTATELREVLHSLRTHVAVLRRQKTPAPPGTSDLLSKLTHELGRRKKHTSHWARRAVIVLLLLVAIAGGAMLVLRERAVSLSHRLEKAVKENEWDRTQSLLDAVDTGINRLLLPSVNSLTDRTRSWQQKVLNSFRELTNQLEVYKRIRTVSALSIEERGSFLRAIRKLPMPYSGRLLAEWDALCRPERETLERQKREAIARISQELRIPPLTGDPRQDRDSLRTSRDELSKECAKFDDVRETFSLDPLLISPLQEQMKKLDTLLRDIENLLRTTQLLDAARNYEDHFKAVEGFAPKSYKPARQAADKLRHLPKPDDMHGQLRAARHGVPASFSPHIIRALLKTGPTFGPTSPANQQHLRLMEDPFTSLTLRRTIYAVDSYGGQTFYTEKAPEMKPDGSVSFELSTMDPMVRTSASMTLKSFAYAGSRVLNASPVMDATGIDRSTFFLQANVPNLLGILTSSKLSNTPALARAYLYNTMLEMLRNLPDQEKLCRVFSPVLKEDTDSFRELCSKVDFPLSVTCWLSHSPRAAQAEKDFAEWFREHANRFYADEIRRNFSTLLKEPMGYVGYVDTDGAPHFKGSPPPPDKTLRYFSEGKLTASPASSPLLSPDPFSPIFAD